MVGEDGSVDGRLDTRYIGLVNDIMLFKSLYENLVNGESCTGADVQQERYRMKLVR